MSTMEEGPEIPGKYTHEKISESLDLLEQRIGDLSYFLIELTDGPPPMAEGKNPVDPILETFGSVYNNIEPRVLKLSNIVKDIQTKLKTILLG